METEEILDTTVVIAGKKGLTTIFTAVEFPPAAQSCHLLFPNTGDFAKAVDIADKLRKKGTPVGGLDTIIAAMCINRNATLITKDKGFSYIKKVEKTFKIKNNNTHSNKPFNFFTSSLER